MEIVFSVADLKQIENLKSRYPETKAAVMPVLWLAQKKFGWISDDVKKLVADTLKLPYSHVHGVVSFYTMYYKKPMGKYHIQVCTNVSCMINGGEDTLKFLNSELGITNNECTADGKFSLEEVECMGACGEAPMVAINQDFYESTDKSKILSILNSLE
ncbi:MAG: NAD(P)H-dependent oxidoreductase subunit E [FCB group bacterium]|jgi:NADH-quinone oxidoreductase E subunit